MTDAITRLENGLNHFAVLFKGQILTTIGN